MRQLLNGRLGLAVHMDDHLRGLSVEGADLVRQSHPEGSRALFQRNQVIEDVIIDLAVAAQALVAVGALYLPDLENSGIVSKRSRPGRFQGTLASPPASVWVALE